MSRTLNRRGWSCAERLSLRCVSAAAAALAVVLPVSAQEQQARPNLVVRHRPAPITTLPVPGALVPITVELLNSKDIEAKIRLVGARDGRFIDIAFPMGALNRQDQAEFTVQVPAPLAAMTYQFIVHQPDGSLSASARYVLKRPCIQNFKVDISPNDPNARVKQELATLIAKSKSLERETTNLEASLKLLEDLSTSLKKQEGGR